MHYKFQLSRILYLVHNKWYFIAIILRKDSVRFDDYGLPEKIVSQKFNGSTCRDIKISDALKFLAIFILFSCFKYNDIWSISLSETLVSGSTIMAQIRDIKISDALKFPGIFTPLTCFKLNDIWLITPSETLVSGSMIMAYRKR